MALVVPALTRHRLSYRHCPNDCLQPFRSIRSKHLGFVEEGLSGQQCRTDGSPRFPVASYSRDSPDRHSHSYRRQSPLPHSQHIELITLKPLCSRPIPVFVATRRVGSRLHPSPPASRFPEPQVSLGPPGPYPPSAIDGSDGSERIACRRD